MLTLNIILQVVRNGERTSHLHSVKGQIKVLCCIVEHEILILKSIVENIIRTGGTPLTLTDTGYFETMIEGVVSFGILGRRCHNSSVTKGIKGWSNLRP